MTFIADGTDVAGLMTIDHVIMTRFNLPTPGREQTIRAREGWLRDRVELFETYCEPSVERQTVQNFHWLIYFDPNSPTWLKSWLEVRRRRFTPVFRESVSQCELVGDLRRISGAAGKMLITTNLDNDDGLAPDFVERVQATASAGERKAIYLTRGVIMRGSRLYLRTDRFNAFCSVSETWDGPATAWADWHNLLGRSMPVLQESGAPAWLQVVHSSNVSNQVHGRRIRPGQVAGLLPPNVPPPADPPPIERLAENIAARPLRGVRTAVRTTLRKALIGTLGRDGFDRLKNSVFAVPARLGRTVKRGVAGRQPS